MKRICLGFLFIFYFTSLYAVEDFIFEVEMGVTWVHNEAYKGANSKDKDPDPILARVGFSFPIYFSKSLFLRPSLTVLSKSWEYDEENKWAMPVDPQWGDLYVLAIMVDIPLGYQFNLNKFSFALFAGPAFDFRIPIWGDDSSVREDMSSYLLGGGKFFNISAGFFFLIPISELVSLTLKGDTWLPIYNIWTDSDLPFSDGLMVSIGAGFRFTF